MEKDNPAIKVEDLNVHYGSNHVLKDINVNIPHLGITAIIGPSGCGKTTLLKSFNRLIELVPGASTSGRIIIDGVNIHDSSVEVTELRKKVGLIGQTPTPLPMSIKDNITYGPMIHGEPRDGFEEKIERCLKSAGLWDEVKDRLTDPAYRLSVGQQQRLSLARALSVEPEVLLCDEPTSALDPISAKYVEEQLLRLKLEYSIVFVTHTLRQAKRISDYVLFMYMGELVEHGPAAKVFNDPEDQRTRDYIEGTFG